MMIANDLMSGTLKKARADVSDVEFDKGGVKRRLTSIGENLMRENRRMDRVEDRLEKTEKRLELREMAEPSEPCRHDR